MTNRRTRMRPGRMLASGLCIASFAAGSLLTLPQSAAAKVRAESMSYGICEMLQRDPVDPAFLEQIRARADFAQIVDFVERNCGGLIDPLIGPTNTIATPRDNRNGGNNGIPTVPAGGVPGDDGGKDDDGGPGPGPEPEPVPPKG